MVVKFTAKTYHFVFDILEGIAIYSITPENISDKSIESRVSYRLLGVSQCQRTEKYSSKPLTSL